MKVPFVMTAINLQYRLLAATSIGHVVYYVIVALSMRDPHAADNISLTQ
jgi:hypothetical protein